MQWPVIHLKKIWLCDKRTLIKGEISINFMSIFGVLIDYHPLTIELVQKNKLKTLYGSSLSLIL